MVQDFSIAKLLPEYSVYVGNIGMLEKKMEATI